MKMPHVVGIMARSPSDPRTKSRLIERIPAAEGRSTLALAFLDDLMDRCGALPGILVRVAVTPPMEGLRLHRPGLPANTFLPQRGAAFGERVRCAFEDLAASGFRHVVLVGADLPDLPAHHVERAFALLDEDPHAVAIGPSDAGGCYLVGLNVAQGAVPDPFSDVRWASPHAQDDLAHACDRLGLAPKWLPTWNDVGSPDDLVFLIDRLRYAPETAPNTAAALRKLGLL
jgi:glycosyltransferase A (GT-A) superfamily protein (DUF2064 family)